MMETGLHEIVEGDRAVLAGIWNPDLLKEQVEEHIDELAFLASTAGASTVARVMQSLDKPKVSTFLGKGKLDELKEVVAEHAATVVVFDDELSPTQLRNIEKRLEMNVIDRTGLILQIFSQHARTAQSRTQVDLAKLDYTLPRLRRMWTHLGRERGGIGMKGAGEQEIETDRRIIRKQMTKLRKDLEKIDRQNQTRRKHRERLVRVALVGYTNVGKSTILNHVAKADVKAENKLFATLDTTVRKVYYDRVPYLLSDTVGFIRKLPHKLVESFKSTLDEVREADLIVHVIDVSNLYYLDHMRVVRETMTEIGATDKSTLLVFNKIDKLQQSDIEDLEQTWLYTENQPAIFVSAETGENMNRLKDLLARLSKDLYRYKYPGLEYQYL